MTVLEKVDTSLLHGVKYFRKFPELPEETPEDPYAIVHKKFVEDRVGEFDWNVDNPLELFAVLSPRVSGGDLSAEDTKGCRIIGVNDTSEPRDVVISSGDMIRGVILYVKDESGNAGINHITVTVESGETIDGESSILLMKNYECLELLSDGTNLFSLNSSIAISPGQLEPSPSPSPS